MFLKRLFSRAPGESQSLYEAIVAAARRPWFYETLAVPDTLDGRFGMISLHLFLVLERLKGEGSVAETFRQELTDIFFKDMDRSLREMGVGDLSVGKKVRKMSEAFYGRVMAYSKALETGEGLAEALRRNIYPEVPGEDGRALAGWVEKARIHLKGLPAAQMLKGEVSFP